MTIQEAKEFFETTDFSPETKQKIFSLLEGKTELDPDTTQAIKDAMQAELDKDFEAAGVKLTEEELKEIDDKYAADLDEIEKDFNKDMNYVEDKLQKIEELRKQIMHASDEAEAEDIKQTI